MLVSLFGIPDLRSLVIAMISIPNRYHLILTCKQIHHQLNNANSWLQQIKVDFPSSHKIDSSIGSDWKSQYQSLYKKLRIEVYGDNRLITVIRPSIGRIIEAYNEIRQRFSPDIAILVDRNYNSIDVTSIPHANNIFIAIIPSGQPIIRGSIFHYCIDSSVIEAITGFDDDDLFHLATLKKFKNYRKMFLIAIIYTLGINCPVEEIPVWCDYDTMTQFLHEKYHLEFYLDYDKIEFYYEWLNSGITKREMIDLMDQYLHDCNRVHYIDGCVDELKQEVNAFRHEFIDSNLYYQEGNRVEPNLYQAKF